MPLRVDRNALRFNQACIIAATVIAFVLGADAGKWLVLAVAAVMLIGTIHARASLFKLAYRHVAVRAGLLHPDIVPEDPAAPQFAQAMGGIVLLTSFICLAGGLIVPGWMLAAVVVALAAVNLFFGFCVGCFLYFQLDRAGIPVPRFGGT